MATKTGASSSSMRPRQYKRHWGAYGNVPNDVDPGPYDPNAPLAQQFRTPVHCVAVASDGLVYVCDRLNNRIQVFQKNGTFVSEFFTDRNTLGNGSAYNAGLSPDRKQTYLFNADGENQHIWTFLRRTGEVLTKTGRGGRFPGHFAAVHSLAVDSKGNVYTGEVDAGMRLQKLATSVSARSDPIAKAMTKTKNTAERGNRWTCTGFGMA